MKKDELRKTSEDRKKGELEDTIEKSNGEQRKDGHSN